MLHKIYDKQAEATLVRCMYLLTPILLLIAFLAAGTLAQSTSSPANLPNVTPETAFISSEKYTNAYFGFSLPLPRDPAFHELSLASKGDGSWYFLLGLQAQRKGLAAFMVTATRSDAMLRDEVRKAASGPKGQDARKIAIGGREFWRSESEQKEPAGTIHGVVFAAALNSYVLKFDIESFDGELTKQLQHCVETLSFFEPARAEEMAGPSSRAYAPAASRNTSAGSLPSSSRIGQLNLGAVSGNIYTNDSLGFRYQFPAGWIVNDKATQDKTIEVGHQDAWGDSRSAARTHEMVQQCSRVLLFVTKHPEGTKTEEVNPLIALMAADPSCFPSAHFPASIDDREAIKQMAQQIASSFAGTPFVPTRQSSASAFMFQGHLMLDISGSYVVNSPGKSAPVDIFTALEFTEVKEYWVAWGFMSGSQAGLQELKNTKIAFVQPSPIAPTAQ
jgi:hypothetical protein